MPPMCLVLHCPTGSRHSRSVNQTYSMFNIPRDENLKRKWEEAIPGDIKLKYGQVICAKHFLENQVVKEFQLKDKYGNVIEKRTYKRPRLKENAVPSIFEMPISVDMVNDHSDSEEFNDLGTKEQNDNFNKVKCSSDIETLQNSLFDPDLLKIISGKYSRESDINSLTNESNRNNLSFASYHIHNNTNTKNDLEIPKQKYEQNNSLQVYYRSIICINNKEVDVPKSWSIIKKNIKNQLILIFIYSVSIIVNESENKDKIKKYVTYNCSNGNVRYFAHGKEVVGIYEDHLLPKLSSAKLLVATLLKFEKMRMCEGLKLEYVPHSIEGYCYMDKFNTWRTKQCTLLARKIKKCEYCNKLMRQLFKKRHHSIQTILADYKVHANAFPLNANFKDKIDSNGTFKKKSEASVEDEYIQEIDNFVLMIGSKTRR